MTLLLLIGHLVLASAQGPSPTDGQWLTPEQAMQLGRKLAEREPFLKSDDARVGRETLGLFFGRRDYDLIRGNPILGYWDAKGFRWEGKRVSWGGIASKGERCKAITPQAWNAAFTYIARKHGLIITSDAPVRMQGACVHAVLTPSKVEPLRGLVMEMRLESPGGTFRYRYTRANPTIEDAVGASIELPILLAQKVNQAGGWREE